MYTIGAMGETAHATESAMSFTSNQEQSFGCEIQWFGDRGGYESERCDTAKDAIEYAKYVLENEDDDPYFADGERLEQVYIFRCKPVGPVHPSGWQDRVADGDADPVFGWDRAETER